MSAPIDDLAPPRAAGRPDRSGRVPPHNLQAEESLLGAMLLSKDAIAAATEILDASDFYKPAHGHIFEAITNLSAAGEPADPVTVAEELRRAGLLEAIGGQAVLADLQASTPATSNAQRYARIVEEHALLRKLIGVAGEIAEMGYEVPDDVTKVVDRAESLVFDVAQRRVTDTMAPIHDLLDANLDRLETLYERGDAITGAPTGFIDLDELLSGLQDSALYVLGARPSAGKTALGLCIATNVAVEAGRPVLIFSLEMSQLELTQRMLCAEARVDSKRVRNGVLTEGDWQKIAHATGRLAEAPIWIDDNPNLTIMELRSKARRLKARIGDLGLVVVDYLQLMTGRSTAENRQVEVSEISRGLKILARELECPVLALSQLSRSLELRADKRPILADLRESGCLTADTRLTRADTGEQVTMGELLERDERDVPIWTLDEHYRLRVGRLSHVFPSGVKTVYEMRLASGRCIKASANHPFLALEGWFPLEKLDVGDFVAVPGEGRWPPSVGAGGGHSTPVVPREVWTYVRKVLPNLGVDVRDLESGFGGRDAFLDQVYGEPLTREQVTRLAELVPDPVLADLAHGDVWWDCIVGITELGEEPVYDATVPGTHNFVAEGVVVHNSIEQDADVVLFIYRDEVYHPDSPDRGTAEILVSKHRNGPTGVVRLAFLDHYTKFANMARGA
ncbi:replicative DNA helicase [Rhabdothermincola sediminis]|uniref:replicative DNA helicase n=1 Tax=Rhabdothermincola sediminis TaxID=2751370 RepID=UPI001AA09856|nr:replicative DNA helicase [Rhabdothermincola sediminis]